MNTNSALRLALLLAAGVTACSAAAYPAVGALVSTSTPTASASYATGTSATVAASALSTASAIESRITPTATHALPGRCVSSILRASLGRHEGAAGSTYVALLLTNRGRVACTLNGYPGVSFTAGAHANQIGAPAQRDHRFAAMRVTLVPGATAHATVRVASSANYARQACKPARATGFRVYPPGSTGSLLVSAPQSVCSKVGVQGFQTSVVRAGTRLE